MKSAGNGDVLNGSLQVLHIHVFLVAPLCTGHMAQPGTDQHEGRVAVREAALMLVCARLRHVAGSQWGNKKYMNMKHLEAAIEDASIAD